MTTLECDLYKKKTKHKILKHINKEAKETANIKGGINENISTLL
jgi:aspartate/glutamate racemase